MNLEVVRISSYLCLSSLTMKVTSLVLTWHCSRHFVYILPIGWFGTGDVKPLGVDFKKYDQDKVRSIQVNLLEAQSDRKSMKTTK